MGGGEPTHPLSSQKALNEAEEGWSRAGQSIHLQLPGWFQQPAPRQATGEAEPGQEHQGEAPQRCQQLGRRPHAGHGGSPRAHSPLEGFSARSCGEMCHPRSKQPVRNKTRPLALPRGSLTKAELVWHALLKHSQEFPVSHSWLFSFSGKKMDLVIIRATQVTCIITDKHLTWHVYMVPTP